MNVTIYTSEGTVNSVMRGNLVRYKGEYIPMAALIDDKRVKRIVSENGGDIYVSYGILILPYLVVFFFIVLLYMLTREIFSIYKR